MAGISSNKHNQDQTLELEGFLNDIQDWERSLKEKGKKSRVQTLNDKKVKGQTKNALISEVSKSYNGSNANTSTKSNYGKYNLRNPDAISHMSSSLSTEDVPDATSEKELGNEYYKQKKYLKAVECYSRSIALSPTAVAFANRGMAYLKIKKFEEAENDCTEALNLDDRYIKAYSRRATARKELGKLKASLEDADFARRLDPDDQELKKLYTDVKAMHDKELIVKASAAMKNSVQSTQELEDLKSKAQSSQDSHVISNHPKRASVIPIEAEHVKDNGKVSSKPVNLITETDRTAHVGERNRELQMEGAWEGEAPIFNKTNLKRDLKTSFQELASHAASQAKVAAAKNISTPRSAYEFAVSWRALSDDYAHKTCLLKTIPAATLPQLFKNALSAPLLIDIIKCIATFFVCREEMELALSFLYNLTRVPRFDMIIMCLSSVDKADLNKIWNEVFTNGAVPVSQAEMLARLHVKYFPGGQMSI